MTVAIVEDEPIVVDGLRMWIKEYPSYDIELVAATASIESLLAGPGADADVLLLDLALHRERVVDRVHELCADGRRVIAFSVHSDPPVVRAVLDAGAAAFLAKSEGGEDCLRVIRDVAEGRPCVTPSMAEAMADGKVVRLSRGEKEALLLWLQCMSKASVARRMGISEATVRQYIARARMKYAAVGRRASSKDAMLARAIEDGLIKAEDVREYRSYAAEPQEE
ncbi:DNA-binding response regulator [Spongiactinospora rosea]|uniref:DNA-binding response regulator n=1 Tax=Spongiactinospora rosea TaxID=2248750 RepID=A0A366M8V5_9ACTN|nr:DNA-binding response regulator [Spongiactinospora rosea]